LAEKHQIALTELTPTGPEGAIIERDVQAYLEAHPAPTITPVARRMAEEAGLEWRELTAAGSGRRITRDDVSRALATETEQEVLETIPMSGVRAVIAERMAQSAAATAPVTLTAEADATALVELRRQLIEDEIAVSYNDLLLYILGQALREHPRLNASLAGDVIKVWQRVDIGLAVDTERGLLVPVVQDVPGKGLTAPHHTGRVEYRTALPDNSG
jgi:pyruvate dehydrogenase E2 component (dihydrolipoamide acetyltransferase)